MSNNYSMTLSYSDIAQISPHLSTGIFAQSIGVYYNAEHASEVFDLMEEFLVSSQGVDYREVVESFESLSNTSLDDSMIDAMLDLKRALAGARKRVGDCKWIAWELYVKKNLTYREVAKICNVGRMTAQRWKNEVDVIIEEELEKFGMLEKNEEYKIIRRRRVDLPEDIEFGDEHIDGVLIKAIPGYGGKYWVSKCGRVYLAGTRVAEFGSPPRVKLFMKGRRFHPNVNTLVKDVFGDEDWSDFDDMDLIDDLCELHGLSRKEAEILVLSGEK